MSFDIKKKWSLGDTPHIDGTFVDGQKSGVFNFRDKDGKLIYNATYDNDLLVLDTTAHKEDETVVANYHMEEDGIKDSVLFLGDKKLAEFELISKVHTSDEWTDYNLPPVGEYIHMVAEEIKLEDGNLAFEIYLPVHIKKIETGRLGIFKSGNTALFGKFAIAMQLRYADVKTIIDSATSEADFNTKFLEFLDIKRRILTSNLLFNDRSDRIIDVIKTASYGYFIDPTIEIGNLKLAPGTTFNWSSGMVINDLKTPTIEIDSITIVDNGSDTLDKLQNIAFSLTMDRRTLRPVIPTFNIDMLENNTEYTVLPNVENVKLISDLRFKVDEGELTKLDLAYIDYYWIEAYAVSEKDDSVTEYTDRTLRFNLKYTNGYLATEYRQLTLNTFKWMLPEVLDKRHRYYIKARIRSKIGVSNWQKFEVDTLTYMFSKKNFLEGTPEYNRLYDFTSYKAVKINKAHSVASETNVTNNEFYVPYMHPLKVEEIYPYIELPKAVSSTSYERLIEHLIKNNYSSATFKNVRYVQRHPSEIYPGTAWELISTDFRLTNIKSVANIAEPKKIVVIDRLKMKLVDGKIHARVKFNCPDIVPEYAKLYRLDVYGSYNLDGSSFRFRRLLLPLEEEAGSYTVEVDVAYAFPTYVDRDMTYYLNVAVQTPYGRSEELQIPVYFAQIITSARPNTPEFNSIFNLSNLVVPRNILFFNMETLIDKYFTESKSVYLWKRMSSHFRVGPYLYKNEFKEWHDDKLARSGTYKLKKNEHGDYFCVLDGVDTIYGDDGVKPLIEREFKEGTMSNYVKLYDLDGKLYNTIIYGEDGHIKYGEFTNFNTDTWNPSLRYTITNANDHKYQVYKGDLPAKNFTTFPMPKFPPKVPADPYTGDGSEYEIIYDGPPQTIEIAKHDIEFVINWGSSKSRVGTKIITKHKIPNDKYFTIEDERVYTEKEEFNVPKAFKRFYDEAKIDNIYMDIKELGKYSGSNVYSIISSLDIETDLDSYKVSKKVYMGDKLRYGSNTGLGVFRDKKQIFINVNYNKDATINVPSEPGKPPINIGHIEDIDPPNQEEYVLINFGVKFGTNSNASFTGKTISTSKEYVDMKIKLAKCGHILSKFNVTLDMASASGLDTRLHKYFDLHPNILPFIKSVDIITSSNKKATSEEVPYIVELTDEMKLDILNTGMFTVHAKFKTYEEYMASRCPYKPGDTVTVRLNAKFGSVSKTSTRTYNLYDLWIFYRAHTDPKYRLKDGERFSEKWVYGVPLNVLEKNLADRKTICHDIMRDWIDNTGGSDLNPWRNVVTKHPYRNQMIRSKWLSTLHSIYATLNDRRATWYGAYVCGFFLSDGADLKYVPFIEQDGWSPSFKSDKSIIPDNYITHRGFEFNVDRVFKLSKEVVIDVLPKNISTVTLNWKKSKFLSGAVDKETRTDWLSTDVSQLNNARLKAIKGAGSGYQDIILDNMVTNMSAMIKRATGPNSVDWIDKHVDEMEFFDIPKESWYNTYPNVPCVDSLRKLVTIATKFRVFKTPNFIPSSELHYMPEYTNGFTGNLSSEGSYDMYGKSIDSTYIFEHGRSYNLYLDWRLTDLERQRYSPYFTRNQQGKANIRIYSRIAPDGQNVKQYNLNLHNIWMSLYNNRLIRPGVLLKNYYTSGYSINLSYDVALELRNNRAFDSFINSRYVTRWGHIPHNTYEYNKIYVNRSETDRYWTDMGVKDVNRFAWSSMNLVKIMPFLTGTFSFYTPAEVNVWRNGGQVTNAITAASRSLSGENALYHRCLLYAVKINLDDMLAWSQDVIYAPEQASINARSARIRSAQAMNFGGGNIAYSQDLAMPDFKNTVAYSGTLKLDKFYAWVYYLMWNIMFRSAVGGQIYASAPIANSSRYDNSISPLINTVAPIGATGKLNDMINLYGRVARLPHRYKLQARLKLGFNVHENMSSSAAYHNHILAETGDIPVTILNTWTSPPRKLMMLRVSTGDESGHGFPLRCIIWKYYGDAEVTRTRFRWASRYEGDLGFHNDPTRNNGRLFWVSMHHDSSFKDLHRSYVKATDQNVVLEVPWGSNSWGGELWGYSDEHPGEWINLCEYPWTTGKTSDGCAINGVWANYDYEAPCTTDCGCRRQCSCNFKDCCDKR